MFFRVMPTRASTSLIFKRITSHLWAAYTFHPGEGQGTFKIFAQGVGSFRRMWYNNRNAVPVRPGAARRRTFGKGAVSVWRIWYNHTMSQENLTTENILQRLPAPLLDWYRANARDLPWRRTRDPYRIWVSEIMLQQTRVEAVKPYFERFMHALPDVKSLAECEEERLLKLWEGLGYYNRVRNMQIAAQTVMEQYDGKLPADYEKLLELKGIGHYTAGAIASIAYGIPVPAVDGNVLRILMRVSADNSDIMKQSVKTRVEQALQQVIPQDCAGSFNQALMELGAIVCVPNGEPLCDQCPWYSFCETRKRGLWQELPVKKKAKGRRIEERTVLVIRDGERVVLKRRPKKGLLAGLYEFPNEPGTLTEDEALRVVQDMHLHPMRIQRLEEAKHIFSHVEWHMTGYWVDLTERPEGFTWGGWETLQQEYALPSAFRAYLEAFTK